MDTPSHSKLVPLHEAIAAHVQPGMHLNFASTPSRANTALLEVARRFRRTDPRFVISATGFHSSAHLLPLLRLGRKYIGCFFGDNYPIPRPNPLYTQLLTEGVPLESWSLWSYVSALRAGALGQEHAINRSFAGTTLGAELAAAGMYRQIEDPQVGLIGAMRSDVTFVHALMGDAEGRAVFSPPYSEGFWGALGARRGVILTVERLVEPAVLASHPDDVKIPADRVLAICHEPFGAHPQPLFALPRFGQSGYRDDFEHYELWRTLTKEPAALAQFEAEVLDGEPTGLRARYHAFVRAERLTALASTSVPTKVPPMRPVEPPRRERRATPIGHRIDVPARENEILLVLGARKIIERVQQRRFRTILAGIGHGFLAARLAKLWLASRGIDVKVMVETGVRDLECGPMGHGFPLAYDNIAQARELSSVEDVLGTLTCGADNGCLGVLGAGQIDPSGDINSTRLQHGKYLTGSGGANDIAACADEVIALTRCVPNRLVERVDYVTSRGRNVSAVITELCTFSRGRAEEPWTVGDVYPAQGGKPLGHVLELIKKGCPWSYEVPEALEYAPHISTQEMMMVHTLDRDGRHWDREKERHA